MDLFSLVATLGLDTSAFDKGLLGIGKNAVGLVNKAIGAAASAAVDFGKDVLETGMKTEKALGRAYSVLNLGNDAYGLAKRDIIEAAVLQEAAASTFDAADVAMAAYYEGLAGYDADEAAAGLHGIIVAAEASGESLQRVADILTDTTTAFGDSASEQSRYADVMAATATSSNTTIGQMGNALKYVGPIAGALGYDIEEVALTLGLMADNAIKGSQAGTTLRNIFTRISTNAGATTKDLGALQIVADKLGVEFYDSEGKVRPWLTVLEEMRTSWAGMDETARTDVANAFAVFSGSAESADDILKGFNEDVQAMTELATDAKNAKSDTAYFQAIKELENLDPSKYKKILDQLGISYRDDALGIAEALDQARIKLGLMGDEERIYFSKQIGSMRGMSGFLALMNATNDKYVELKDNIYNAAGAADSMRDISLDNLSGDVERFNAQLDVLKYAIFDEVKGPLRDVVQYATDALGRIQDAISKDGLEGGIRQLGIEIEGMANQFAPMLESLGKALVPLFTTLINGLVENVGPALVTAGSSLAAGIFQGLDDALSSTNNPILSWIGNMFGDTVSLGKYWNSHSLANGAGGLTSASLAPVPIQVSPQVDMAAIQKAVQDASNAGNTVVSINGVEYSTDFPDVIAAAVQTAIDSGTTAGFENFIIQGSTASGTVATAIQNGLSNAGQIGGELMTAVLGGIIDVAAPGFGSTIAGAITNAGTVGGPPMFSNVLGAVSNSVSRLTSTISNAVSQGGSTGGNKAATNVDMSFVRRKSIISSSVSSAIGSAGNSAGNDLVNKIQRKFSLAHFAVNVIGNLITSFTGGKRYAKAMNTGRILHGAQVFGVDNTGSPLIGGEAGNEAIVGTTELERLIAGAVAKGNGGGVNAEINIYQQPGQDPRELAEIIQRELVRIGRQKRAVYA